MSDDRTSSVTSSQRKGPEGLRALDRAVQILYALAAHPNGISLADLSRGTGLSMPTVHRILAALRSKDLTRETPSGLHGLGIGTVVLSGAYLAGLDLRAEARPHLEQLNIETNETCHLGSLASPQIVYIEKMDSAHPVRMFSRVGSTMPAVVTAMGKAILANSSDEQLIQTLADTRFQLGVIVDEVAFREVLQDVRRRGFSLDLEENERGICCVGAPIFDSAGRVIAAVSVSTPAERFDRNGIDAFGALVRHTADDISASLGYLAPERIGWLRGLTGEDGG